MNTDKGYISSPNFDSLTITTIDEVEHDWEEIISKMDDDDFYYGYLGKVALSSSIIKTILKSPKEYHRYIKEGGSEETQALRDGKLFHWRILEPHVFEALNIVEVGSRNTKAYKEAVAELGYVFLRKEIDNSITLTDALTQNDEVKEYLTDAFYEVPQIQMIDGIPIRGKADIIKGDAIIDLKTTADISTFKYSARKFGYDLQAYLYLQLFPECNSFKFICIDKKTKDIGIYECSQEFLDSGKEKLEKGIRIFKDLFYKNIETEKTLSQLVIKGTL
jgi:hypothetical protein|tara:strand:- start:7349 stop:8176 length:828 start_codon:yes stop_codon:yes gene_type:complete